MRTEEDDDGEGVAGERLEEEKARAQDQPDPQRRARHLLAALAASRHGRGTTEVAAPRAARATRDTASEAAPVRSVTSGPRSSGMYMMRKAADR